VRRLNNPFTTGILEGYWDAHEKGGEMSMLEAWIIYMRSELLLNLAVP
jgi:hypothetical protein